MRTPKGKEKREEDLAAYLETHKDEGDWEEVELDRPARVSSVYSIRFTAQELDALRAVADSEGKRISQVVRDAVSKYIASRREHRPANMVDFDRGRFFSFSSTAISTTAVGPEVKWEGLGGAHPLTA